MVTVVAFGLLLSACSSFRTETQPVQSVPVKAANSVVVPAGAYPKRTREAPQLAVSAGASVVAGDGQSTMKPESELRGSPVVWLYLSTPSQAYLAKTGIDPAVSLRVWETFLRKYKIPFVKVLSVEGLEQMQSGVLLLPSVVAMSEREKQAVVGFRSKGGSVLSTWLTGVRSESGEWTGFDFMDKTLDVRVVGNTEGAEDDNFMIVHGDNPITHHLPAGMRVWLERVDSLLPLRLVGKHYAAHIMDWSRTFSPDKQTGLITFDERMQTSGKASRNVVLGYPEQLWLAADPEMVESIAHNALLWLFRQTDSYVAAWPYPNASGFVMAVAGTEDVADVDLEFANQLEAAGAKATYYILGETLAKSASVVKKLQARGHEVGYLGDRFEGFKDQPLATQATRLDAMRKMFEDAGVQLAAGAGFAAPLDSYDRATEQLLVDRKMGHYIAFMDATDARLPFFPKTGESPQKNTVVLPRTQPGPEEAIEEGDPDVGFQGFLDEFSLSESMGGLSVIRIPSQTLLTEDQRKKMFDHLKARRDKMWMSTAGGVAQWWRERSRISVRLVPNSKAPILVVTVQGENELTIPAAVLINLPQMDGSLRIESPEADNPLPMVGKIDAWRSAIILDGLVPGDYCWYLYFDAPPKGKN